MTVIVFKQHPISTSRWVTDPETNNYVPSVLSKYLETVPRPISKQNTEIDPLATCAHGAQLRERIILHAEIRDHLAMLNFAVYFATSIHFFGKNIRSIYSENSYPPTTHQHGTNHLIDLPPFQMAHPSITPRILDYHGSYLIKKTKVIFSTGDIESLNAHIDTIVFFANNQIDKQKIERDLLQLFQNYDASSLESKTNNNTDLSKAIAKSKDELKKYLDNHKDCPNDFVNLFKQFFITKPEEYQLIKITELIDIIVGLKDLPEDLKHVLEHSKTIIESHIYYKIERILEGAFAEGIISEQTYLYQCNSITNQLPADINQFIDGPLENFLRPLFHQFLNNTINESVSSNMTFTQLLQKAYESFKIKEQWIYHHLSNFYQTKFDELQHIERCDRNFRKFAITIQNKLIEGPISEEDAQQLYSLCSKLENAKRSFNDNLFKMYDQSEFKFFHPMAKIQFQNRFSLPIHITDPINFFTKHIKDFCSSIDISAQFQNKFKELREQLGFLQNIDLFPQKLKEMFDGDADFKQFAEDHPDMNYNDLLINYKTYLLHIQQEQAGDCNGCFDMFDEDISPNLDNPQFNQSPTISHCSEPSLNHDQKISFIEIYLYMDKIKNKLKKLPQDIKIKLNQSDEDIESLDFIRLEEVIKKAIAIIEDPQQFSPHRILEFYPHQALSNQLLFFTNYSFFDYSKPIRDFNLLIHYAILGKDYSPVDISMYNHLLPFNSKSDGVIVSSCLQLLNRNVVCIYPSGGNHNSH